LGLQFEALLENDLYLHLADHANNMADRIRNTLRELHYSLFVDAPTNQVFPILPDVILDTIAEQVTFSEVERVDSNNRVVRFCTSWGTSQEDVDYLCKLLLDVSRNS
jgi:threonine aldolase